MLVFLGAPILVYSNLTQIDGGTKKLMISLVAARASVLRDPPRTLLGNHPSCAGTSSVRIIQQLLGETQQGCHNGRRIRLTTWDV